LINLINPRNFGEIYQIAKRIGIVLVEKEVYQELLRPESLFWNDEQTNMMIQEEKEEYIRENDAAEGSGEQINAIIEIMK
jgi:hypothetical protein